MHAPPWYIEPSLSRNFVALLLQVQQDPKAALSRMQNLLNKSLEVAAATWPSTAGVGKLAEWQSPGLDDLAYKLVTLTMSGGDDDIDLHAGKVTLALSAQIASPSPFDHKKHKLIIRVTVGGKQC